MKKSIPILAGVIALLAILVLGSLAGCTPDKPSAAAKQQIQTKVDAGAVAVVSVTTQKSVELAGAKGNDALGKELGDNKPVSHPFDSWNNTINTLRTWSIRVCIVSGILLVICFSLGKTEYLAFLAKFVLPLRWAFVLTLIASITLPFFPWAIAALVAGVIGLIIYELIRYKGNLPSAEAALRQDWDEVFDQYKPQPTGPTQTASVLTGSIQVTKVTPGFSATDANKLASAVQSTAQKVEDVLPKSI